MTIDTANTVIIAGWYPDPTDDFQARWWDGSQWTSTTRERHPVPPPQDNRQLPPVPIRTDATLPPINPYRPMKRRHETQDHLSSVTKTSMPFQPTRAYTATVWTIATMPLWSTILVLALLITLGHFYSTFLIVLTNIILFASAVALTFHDRHVLKNLLHGTSASPWWVLLTPTAYLIARGIHVKRAVGRGWAPLIVNILCWFVPTAAMLAFSVIYYVVFSTMLGAG